jgi:hypothetical protein
MRFRFTLNHVASCLMEGYPFSEWTNDGLILNEPWITGSVPTVTIPNGDQSKGLHRTGISGIPAGPYTLTYSITSTKQDFVSAEVRFLKAGVNISQQLPDLPGFDEILIPLIIGTASGTKDIILSDAPDEVWIQVFDAGSVGSTTVTLNRLDICGIEVDNSQEISEPDGWKGGKLKLERDDQFFSLIERYEGSAGGAFIFYGDNGEENGGIEFIRNIEESFGFDANIEFLAEFAPDDVDYQEIFDGLLELSGKNEMKDNKMQVPVIRDDFWSKFMSRMDTPVNLSDLVDLDGNSVDPVVPVTVNLKSQKIRYNGEYVWKEPVTYREDGLEAMSLDWDEVIIDDIKKFTLPRVHVPTLATLSGNIYADVVGLIEAPWDGVYNFDVRIEMSEYQPAIPAWTTPSINIWINKYGETDGRAEFTETVNTYGSDTVKVYSYTGSWQLTKGEQIVIYGQGTDDGEDETIFGSRLLNWVTDCRAATTGNITLSGTPTIDGVSLIAGDRVLVKNQSDSRLNGVYVVAAGAWSRASDVNTAVELQDAAVRIDEGTVNIDTYWSQEFENVEVGVTSITFEFRLSDDTYLRAYPGPGTPDTHLIITADTTYADTTAEGYLIHDLIFGVLQRIGLGSNPFYSEFLGSTLTNSKVYDEDGCGWMYVILKGLQIRQYTLTEKPFFISFKQIWDGINPILNLGLGYEMIDESPDYQAIRIEQKEHFLEDDISVYFSNVREISSSYDQNMIFKKVKLGYKKWQSEDISGIDDPQTKHTYATRFEKVGKEISLESDFIAASLAIETTRRTTKEKSADYKYDNDNFIIALNEDDVSPDVYSPELDENFDSVTGILNSDTRYNLILTPMRNLLRWANFLSGCLQPYTNSSYKFVSGEGNYDMVSDYSCSLGNSCQAIICDSLGESQNIPLSYPFGYYFLPMIYDISVPMEWEEYQEIRDNRKKAIGISQSNSGHIPFKIKLLEYDLVKGEALIKAWPKTFFRINVIDSTPEMECNLPAPEPPVEFDEDYQAILDYAEGQSYDLPSEDQQELQNQLVLDLKAAGVWGELDLLYVFATDGDRDFAKINWIDPGNFDCSETNNPAHITNVGFDFNGIDNYLDTGWIASDDAVQYTLNDASLFLYINNEISTSSDFETGVQQTGSIETLLAVKSIGQTHAFNINAASTALRGSSVSSIGLFHTQRTASNAMRIFKGGSQVGTDSTEASTSVPSSRTFTIGAARSSTVTGFSDAQIGFYGIGASLSGKESSLNTVWNDYFTSL